MKVEESPPAIPNDHVEESPPTIPNDHAEESPPAIPNDHIAIDAIQQAILVLQDEQSQFPREKRAIVLTNLETALLWQKYSMGLIS